MGRCHGLAEPPRQPAENQGADGAWLPSARRCRRSARILRRSARGLKEIPRVASKQTAHVRRAPPPENKGENMTEKTAKGPAPAQKFGRIPPLVPAANPNPIAPNRPTM